MYIWSFLQRFSSAASFMYNFFELKRTDRYTAREYKSIYMRA